MPKPKGAPVKAGIAAGSLASDGPAVSLPSDPTMAGMDVRFDLPAGMIEDLEHRRVSLAYAHGAADTYLRTLRDGRVEEICPI